MIRWYRGPWQWVTDERMSFWSVPWARWSLDLRSLPEQTQQGGSPGLGIFATTEAISDSNYDLIGYGNWHDVKPNQRTKDAIPARKNYKVKGDDLIGCLFDLLTDGADPDGGDFAKPLVPTVSGRLELHCGKSFYDRFTYGKHGHSSKIKQMLRKEFGELFVEAKAGKLKDVEHHRRVLDYWCEKYGVDDWREFVPQQLQKDVPGRLKHETTITDNFTRADASTLGSSAEGWSWSTMTGVGAGKIISNEAGLNTGVDARSRADSDLSSSDNYGQAVIKVWGSSDSAEPIARCSSAAATFYIYIPRNNATNAHRVFKCATGTFTQLAAANNDVPTLPATARLTCNGSSIESTMNSIARNSFSDTSITSGLRTGLGFNCNSAVKVSADDFAGADVATAGTNYTQLQSTHRGLLRGVYTRY